MNKVELQVMTSAAQRFCDHLVAIKPSCVNCVAFDGTTCATYECAPPPEVQAVGCDEWKFDGVPF
jgi:hypothetical protein